MDLEADLNRLGGSQCEVAEALMKKGVRGQRMKNGCCPVAVYLHQCHPDHRFEVDNRRVQIDGEGRCWLPKPVRLFIQAFDEGDYPGLILHGEQGGGEVPK